MHEASIGEETTVRHPGANQIYHEDTVTVEPSWWYRPQLQPCGKLDLTVASVRLRPSIHSRWGCAALQPQIFFPFPALLANCFDPGAVTGSEM